MKRVLFIDRDGTLIVEPTDNFQVDSLEKLEFLPGVFRNLYKIRKKLAFELVMVSNQDGLGTEAYPEEKFNKVQSVMLKTFKNEGIEFDNILIDRSLQEDNLPSRKPGVAMLERYLSGKYDLHGSYVIGDRITDMEMARNLGAKGILIGHISPDHKIIGAGLKKNRVIMVQNWNEISDFLIKREHYACIRRKTNETEISISMSLYGTGISNISTGLGFLDHMLEQLTIHSGCDISIQAKGDLHVDEHHTIEDIALVLGEAFRKAIGKKIGIERFGFSVPMDDSIASVAVDLGGRNWLDWDVEFKREKIGNIPAEMFRHFFKSFSDTAKCNLHISAKGENEHHKIESVFKAVARAIKMAVNQDTDKLQIPSTKGKI